MRRSAATVPSIRHRRQSGASERRRALFGARRASSWSGRAGRGRASSKPLVSVPRPRRVVVRGLETTPELSALEVPTSVLVALHHGCSSDARTPSSLPSAPGTSTILPSQRAAVSHLRYGGLFLARRTDSAEFRPFMVTYPDLTGVRKPGQRRWGAARNLRAVIGLVHVLGAREPRRGAGRGL